MPYQIDGAIKARDLGHDPGFIATARFTATYSVDKYLCRCGAQVQIASDSKVGVWVSDSALKPCPANH